jgi:drug/metabolite transporter (DMT)-like permease
VADLALLALTLVWGTTFTLVKLALDGNSTAVFLVLRFGVAFAAMGAIWLWRRPPVTPGLWRDGTLLGLVMFGGFALQTVGLRFTTPARSGFLTGLAVLIVPFVARFVMRRRVMFASWTGVALAVVGLVLLTQPFGDGVTGTVRLGDALTMGCSVAYAFQVIWTSEFSPRHSLVALVAVQIGVTFAGTLLMLPLEPARFTPSPGLLGTVLFTGLVMTVGAFFVMNWAQRHTTAVRAALIYALEPPAAAVFSHLVTGETLAPSGILGGALIVLGVVAGEVGGAIESRRRTRA